MAPDWTSMNRETAKTLGITLSLSLSLFTFSLPPHRIFYLPANLCPFKASERIFFVTVYCFKRNGQQPTRSIIVHPRNRIENTQFSFPTRFIQFNSQILNEFNDSSMKKFCNLLERKKKCSSRSVGAAFGAVHQAT